VVVNPRKVERNLCVKTREEAKRDARKREVAKDNPNVNSNRINHHPINSIKTYLHFLHSSFK
jgi:hypothetical protein